MIKSSETPAARYNSARAGSQHTLFVLTVPAIVDGLSGHIWTQRDSDFGQRENRHQESIFRSPDAESLLDKYGVD